MLTKKQINDLYEESVWQIRLRIAANLVHVQGVTHRDALDEADEFIKLLMSESIDELHRKFP